MRPIEHDRVAAAMAEQLTCYRRAAADFDRHANEALLTQVTGRLRGRVDFSGLERLERLGDLSGARAQGRDPATHATLRAPDLERDLLEASVDPATVQKLARHAAVQQRRRQESTREMTFLGDRCFGVPSSAAIYRLSIDDQSGYSLGATGWCTQRQKHARTSGVTVAQRRHV